MCVIMIAKTVRPTPDMVIKAWDANPDGAGIAWREGIEDNTEVVWEKGIMDKDSALELAANTPLPYVMHFRVASVGGVRQALTHPFQVEMDAPLGLSGRTKGMLLFHNGHWAAWAEKSMEAAIHSNAVVPTGAWSDTRALAWLTWLYGPGFMELLPAQKGVLMDPFGQTVFTGDGWYHINDVWCSNNWFMKKYESKVTNHVPFVPTMCAFGKCVKKRIVGDVYCETHMDRTNRETNANTTNTLITLPVAEAELVEDATTPVAEAGGASETDIPFGEAVAIKEAEAAYRQGMISKSLLRKIRKCERMIAAGGSKGLRAKKNLSLHLQIVATLTKEQVVGSKH
jgi:hypothetical protein